MPVVSRVHKNCTVRNKGYSAFVHPYKPVLFTRRIQSNYGARREATRTSHPEESIAADEAADAPLNVGKTGEAAGFAF